MERRVLVTGGTGIIGSEIVRQLVSDCSHSASVIANYSRNPDRARHLQQQTGCELCQADISDEGQVEALFAELGPLDAVIHAAAAVHDALLIRQSRASWDEALRINAAGSFLVVRGALQNLKKGGRLVLLASRSGESGRAGQTSYAAAKAASIALIKSAAFEGAQHGFCCNAVCPGFIPSPLSEGMSADELETVRSESLFGHFGTAAEVASLVCWLLGPHAAAVTGQVFHCDARLKSSGK